MCEVAARLRLRIVLSAGNGVKAEWRRSGDEECGNKYPRARRPRYQAKEQSYTESPASACRGSVNAGRCLGARVSVAVGGLAEKAKIVLDDLILLRNRRAVDPFDMAIAEETVPPVHAMNVS